MVMHEKCSLIKLKILFQKVDLMINDNDVKN